ncbi:tetratricopeptide repeat protein [Paracoccus sp. Z118]|nr:tetratricopeptide repeat protein [Paracoccus sp. Z118]MBV0892519.1 tetratricopeptide repeat protein [Paracoccus sp. Z118]
MRGFFLGFHPVVTALAVALSLSVAAAQTADTTPAMDDLFAELAQPEGEGWAAAESDILREWSRSGSASADLLLKRGYDALDAGDTAGAIGHFTALTDHAPDFPAGWFGRAEAFYLSGQFGPAAADLERVLQLEPRHWPALTQLGTMLEEVGSDGAALTAYLESMSINPHQAEAEDGVARLLQASRGVGI